jgi:hypothetical protein
VGVGVIGVGGLYQGIEALIKIFEFGVNHWPHIHHYLQLLNGSVVAVVRPEGTNVTGSKRQILVAFDNWFSSLPPEIQAEIEEHFGDIGEIMAAAEAELD